jgi:S-DNA-T family DNA segregation ATPase FtsK/SpoIIIE
MKMRAQADKLIAKFKDFGIDGRIREIRPGPVCTTYELVPAPGIKVSKIAALADDIAMAMEAVQVRIVAPIPGKGAVGIEIPNEKRETVYMKEIIADPAFKKIDHKLMMALGKDIEGRAYYANLADMPHVLISGTTGSGKSVSVNAMICSMLYRASPDDVRFIMIDPKMLELSIYEGIPHLLVPPIIDSKKAAAALRWAVQEMERRYQLMSELGVRDMAGFNTKVQDAIDGKDDAAKKTLTEALKGKPIEKFPYIVIVVDEYADLLAVAGKDVEGYVMRLAQKARAAGLHVMLATQRPSVDVITGVIKANFPVRMGFRLASNHDSKTIINRPGAEKLLGRGDMLFMPPGTSNVTRVHGAFISEKELHRVVEYLKEQRKPQYNMDILTAAAEEEEGGGGDVVDEPKDSRYDEALAVVARTKKCSTSWLQRMMNLGYQRAARIVDRMERDGHVGPALNAKGDREIYVKPEHLAVPGS